MPQSPTSVDPVIMSSARGINDISDPTKLEKGYTPFALNFSVSGDVWPRRQGRDMFYLNDGNLVTSLYTLTWDDGSYNIIASIGDTFYTFIPFTYAFNFGIRLILQSASLAWWNVTPNATTGLISPTVVADPATPSKTSDLFVDASQSLAFRGNSGFTQLSIDQLNEGWYLHGGNGDFGAITFTSDVVFSYASGASLIMADLQGNTWRYSMTNDGDLIVTTV